MAAKISIKQASLTLASTVDKFKTAQLGGTMSPDEAIEAINPIIEMAATIAEIGSEIQESIPGEQGGEGIDVTQNNQEKPEEDNSMHGAADHGLGDESEDDNDLRNRFSQLQAQFEELKKENETIKEDSQKEKLAQKYAQLFPVPMRESKISEFMSRVQPVGILEAQVNEAQALLGGKVAASIKQAQIEEGTFDLNNNFDDTETNQNYLPGGKF